MGEFTVDVDVDGAEEVDVLDPVLRTQVDDPGQTRATRPHTSGVAQEIYALLVTYQALRTTISDAMLTRPDLDPDRGSFSVALHTARDQLVSAAGVLIDTTAGAVTDLVGALGRAVLDHLLPARRSRSGPRVVKRAISVYAPNTARGRTRGPSRTTSISITVSGESP